MVKHFYSFVVETETLFIEIDSLTISEDEKVHLKSLAESHIHHAVLDSILSELTGADRKTFISHLNSKDHARMWKFINSKIEGAEEKIKEAANFIKKELHKDIAEARRTN